MDGVTKWDLWADFHSPALLLDLPLRYCSGICGLGGMSGGGGDVDTVELLADPKFKTLGLRDRTVLFDCGRSDSRTGV